ncbi:hypothetical protein [Butyrivibrio sp. YAB3001]|uniref:hypothetical protein n=1 Tax=Butyrivibrio sp. YAB3001 TaxID=1520812 RepID=UPI0008F61C94|nr:hypothetical protein [Butyrivibrio sp. YAB3001]SFB66455.1 hypothetical protein SAMN02910398_00005 [Butyrivibrio sp. YAB3001]
MKINIMKKHEKFIGMSEGKIFLERPNGEVRIVRLIEDDDGIRIAPEEIIIGYGSGTVVIGDIDNSVEITNF